MIGDRRTRTILAVLSGARTVREVAAILGCSIDTAWRELKWARGEGLVAWEDHRDGTMRASVRVVANP